MADIKEYVKPKNKPEKEKFHGQIIHHKRAVFYRSLLSLLVVAGILGVLYIQWKNKEYSSYEVVSSIVKEEVSGTEVADLNGNILIYSKDGISCTALDGNAIWNQTFEMQEPLIDIRDNVVAIGDYNGRTIYVMNSTEIMGEITTTLPIKYFCVSSQGVVAAVLEDTDTTWIYIYNSDGEEIGWFKTTMDQSGYPVAVNISDNSEITAVSFLSKDMVTNVAFYNFGAVGKNYLDNFASGYEYADTIVPTLGFLDEETAFAVADSRIMFYKGKQKPVSDGEIILQDQVQSVFYGDGYVGLVYIDATGENKYRLDVYNAAGKLVLNKYFNLDYKDIIFTNENVVIYNSGECEICSMTGILKFKGTFNKQVQLVMPTTSFHKFVLVGGDYIDTIELK